MFTPHLISTMSERRDHTNFENLTGLLAMICLLAFFAQCGWMFLQWGDIEEGGTQELQYLAMFLGIVGVLFLILNRTSKVNELRR